VLDGARRMPLTYPKFFFGASRSAWFLLRFRVLVVKSLRCLFYLFKNRVQFSLYMGVLDGVHKNRPPRELHVGASCRCEYWKKIGVVARYDPSAVFLCS
jgi:hypothetical protein